MLNEKWPGLRHEWQRERYARDLRQLIDEQKHSAYTLADKIARELDWPSPIASIRSRINEFLNPQSNTREPTVFEHMVLSAALDTDGNWGLDSYGPPRRPVRIEGATATARAYATRPLRRSFGEVASD